MTCLSNSIDFPQLVLVTYCEIYISEHRNYPSLMFPNAKGNNGRTCGLSIYPWKGSNRIDVIELIKTYILCLFGSLSFTLLRSYSLQKSFKLLKLLLCLLFKFTVYIIWELMPLPLTCIPLLRVLLLLPLSHSTDSEVDPAAPQCSFLSLSRPFCKDISIIRLIYYVNQNFYILIQGALSIKSHIT